MPKKFHIGKNGAAPCSATKRACRYGGDDNHYTSLQDANSVYEKTLSKEAGGNFGVIIETERSYDDVYQELASHREKDAKLNALALNDQSEEMTGKLNDSYKKLTDLEDELDAFTRPTESEEGSHQATLSKHYVPEDKRSTEEVYNNKKYNSLYKVNGFAIARAGQYPDDIAPTVKNTLIKATRGASGGFLSPQEENEIINDAFETYEIKVSNPDASEKPTKIGIDTLDNAIKRARREAQAKITTTALGKATKVLEEDNAYKIRDRSSQDVIHHNRAENSENPYHLYERDVNNPKSGEYGSNRIKVTEKYDADNKPYWVLSGDIEREGAGVVYSNSRTAQSPGEVENEAQFLRSEQTAYRYTGNKGNDVIFRDDLYSLEDPDNPSREGYLAERRNLEEDGVPKSSRGASDRTLIEHFNREGMSKEELSTWVNSKLGSQYANTILNPWESNKKNPLVEALLPKKGESLNENIERYTSQMKSFYGVR